MPRSSASGNRELAKRVVLTIGHSNRTLEAFLELLRAHGAERVVDVRTIPRSRRNPQFSRETLPGKLRAAGIGYVHLAKLGGLRRARCDSPNTGWRNSSFRGFADYMQTLDFEAGLRRLIKLVKQKRSAMLCAEAVPWRCHRSLISDALVVRGIPVEHIMSGKRRRTHSLTGFARVRGKRITYPPAKAGSKLRAVTEAAAGRAGRRPATAPSAAGPAAPANRRRNRRERCGHNLQRLAGPVHRQHD